MPRRLPIFSPGYWHPQAARPRNFLVNGPAVRRPVVVPVTRFTQPVRGIPLVGGQGTATVSSTSGGAAALVQTATGTGAGNGTVTVTLAATKTGNCLVAYVGADQGTTNPTVSGITLGGLAGNWAVAQASNNNADTDAEIWVDWNCAGGQTSVVVTLAGGTGAGGLSAVRVEEWSGILATGTPVDQVNGANGNSAAPNSGATPTLSQANELVVGAISAGQAPTGPASPWTNEPVLNASGLRLLSGYQAVSATTGLAYSGTMTAGVWGAVVVSLKVAPPSGTAGLATISVGPQGLGNVWYPAQVNVQTTSLQNDTSICQVFMGPAQQPVTLLGTIFPGGFGTLAAAVPAMTPGQYLIAQWTGANPGDVASLNVIGTMDSIMIG